MARSPATARRAVTPETVEPTVTSLNMAALPEKLGYCLRVAQNRVFREFTDTFGPYAVTPGLHVVLMLIDANPGCRQADLGAALGVKQPNLVEKIDTMVARGLVTRMPDPSDRRANILSLTPAGQSFVAELVRVEEGLTERLEQRLGARDHAELIRLLRRLTGS